MSSAGGVMTVAETAAAVREKRISACEAVQGALEAIDARNPTVQAIICCEAERALQAAEAVDERISRGESIGPLAGVPIAVKDNICTRGTRTTCASNMLKRFAPPYDAHVIERLTSAGAIVVAKTNLDEFAMGSSTENSSFTVTRNPWNTEHVAGGSSGGSAAAVASGMVAASLGSDTGGSIRQPASFCGVVGLKPTYGRVSRYGLVAFGSSLDQIGPMSSDARDAAILLSVIAGADRRDSTSVDEPVPDYTADLDTDLRGVRVGVAAEYFGEGLDDEVKTTVTTAVDVLRDQGAELVEVHLPHLKYAIACYYVVATAEASSNLARYDGVHYGHRTEDPDDLIALYSQSRREGFGPEVKRRIMLGTYVLSSGYYDAYYLKALKVRTLIKDDFEEAFEKVDVIASPVAPTTAFAVGEKTGDPLSMYLADVYTISANLAGIPGISVPCGFDAGGLPIGMQLCGPWFAEGRLLNLAHRYQQHTDFHRRVPAN
jgi:aspartyl-tRNA(Asn)/glutamyl-tRNA(Gln) amidotransferase subunit A